MATPTVRQGQFPTGIEYLNFGNGSKTLLVGRRLLGPIDPVFRRDVLIEAEAEAKHDSLADLARIRVPVLVVSGADDFAFPLEEVRTMAAAIPTAKLVSYDRGHSNLLFDRRFRADVRAFTSELGPAPDPA